MFIKKHKVISSIIGLFLLFVISLGGTIAIANATRAKEVAIPNLVGKTVEEAKQILAESKLNFVEEEPEYNAQFEAGKIISQNPPFVEGRNLKENAQVKVVVSLGTEKTTVPVLKGKTREEAETAAKEAKIELDIVEETSETVEAGYIIKQEVEPNTEVNAGDVVKVYLSIGTGRTPVVVTSVLYKEEAVAKQTLEGLGLVVKIEYDENKERDNGVVLKQSVKEGETVDEGSEITITVNKLAELKSGKVIIDVKSFTGFEDKITVTEKDEETGEEVEVEKDNTPEEISFKVTVDGEQITTNSETVLENETKKEVTVNGKGTVEIKVWIDGALKGPYSMNLNEKQEMTIKK